MKKMRFEISVEQHEAWRVSQTDAVETQACGRCIDEPPMIPAENLAALAGISPREVYRQIEDGSLHVVETPARKVLVCLASFSGLNDVSENTNKRIFANEELMPGSDDLRSTIGD